MTLQQILVTAAVLAAGCYLLILAMRSYRSFRKLAGGGGSCNSCKCGTKSAAPR